MKALSNDEWPDVIEVPDEDFRTADEGLKYLEMRMECLRTSLLARGRENAKLQKLLRFYRAGFWLLVALALSIALGMMLRAIAMEVWS